MTFPRIIVLLVIILFGGIGAAALFKGEKKVSHPEAVMAPLEVELEPAPVVFEAQEEEGDDSPEAVDRIAEFFNKREPKLPIVQTVTYKSKVSWKKGGPAWLTDYASHYKTSRHFIARSLNGKPDYIKQDVSEGDKFNVFKEDKKFEFHLLVDLSACKLYFYYFDLDTGDHVLVKTYKVGVGREAPNSPSGYLTPLGIYTLGDKIAVYRPKAMANHQGERTEMIRIFGSRWIPFADEVEGCTASPKGFGIHGLPWVENERGELVEQIESLGGYHSDGCIRLATKDIEEIFAIVISRPTKIQIVDKYSNAKLPKKAG